MEENDEIRNDNVEVIRRLMTFPQFMSENELYVWKWRFHQGGLSSPALLAYILVLFMMV